MPARQGTYRPPPVGVMARTAHIARSLAQELRIESPVCLSPNTSAGRGVNLGALLVTQDCWPLPAEIRDALLPALEVHRGYVMVIVRHDPQKGLRAEIPPPLRPGPRPHRADRQPQHHGVHDQGRP